MYIVFGCTIFKARSKNCDKRLFSSYVCLRLSVRPSARNSLTLTERIFMKFDIEYFPKSVEKIEVSLKSD